MLACHGTSISAPKRCCFRVALALMLMLFLGGCAGDFDPQSGTWYAQVTHKQATDGESRPQRYVGVRLYEGTPPRGIWRGVVNRDEFIAILVDAQRRAYSVDSFAEGQWLQVSGTLEAKPVRTPDGRGYLHWESPPIEYVSAGGPTAPVLRAWARLTVLSVPPATRPADETRREDGAETERKRGRK